MDATGSVSRQLPVAVSQEITSIPGNGQTDSCSFFPLRQFTIHGSVAQQVVTLRPHSAPARESCGHFTLLFILLLIFSFLSIASFSSLLVFVRSFANYNDSYQSQSSPEGNASPIGRSTVAERRRVRAAGCGVRAWEWKWKWSEWAFNETQ